MRRVLGVICMSAGAALLIGALSLFLWNRNEADRAEQSSMAVIPLLNIAIEEREEQRKTSPSVIQPLTPVELLTPEEKQMTEVEIDGHSYIGYLSIPSQGRDLPVMSQWDYSKLKIAPCRFSGTTIEENLVLIAHNYFSHFGVLHQIQLGDEVFFTDMDGTVIAYQVAAIDVVPPTAVEEVTAGDFDLALITCTYGGKTRLVVYCDEYQKEA